MASESSSAKGKSNVSENQFVAGNNFFSFLQSMEINYDLNNDELEIHPKKEAQVNILTQRSKTQARNKSEEDTATAS